MGDKRKEGVTAKRSKSDHGSGEALLTVAHMLDVNDMEQLPEQLHTTLIEMDKSTLDLDVHGEEPPSALLPVIPQKVWEEAVALMPGLLYHTGQQPLLTEHQTDLDPPVIETQTNELMVNQIGVKPKGRPKGGKLYSLLLSSVLTYIYYIFANCY